MASKYLLRKYWMEYLKDLFGEPVGWMPEWDFKCSYPANFPRVMSDQFRTSGLWYKTGDFIIGYHGSGEHVSASGQVIALPIIHIAHGCVISEVIPSPFTISRAEEVCAVLETLTRPQNIPTLISIPWLQPVLDSYFKGPIVEAYLKGQP